MKKITSIVLLAICKLNVLYATDTTTLRQYYETVHYANIQVCKGGTKGTADIFDSAFSLLPYPYHIDISNALYVRVHSIKPDTGKIISYLKILQKKGICVHKEFRKSEKHAPFLNLVSESECKKVLNESMRKSIENAIAEDQRIRNYSSEKFNEFYHVSLLPNISKIDSINYTTVIKVLETAEEKDIPLEELIGMESVYNVFNVLLHNVPWGRYNNALLERLVKKGILEARYTSFSIDDFCGRNINSSIKSDYDNVYNCRDNSIYGNRILFQTFTSSLISIPAEEEQKRLNNKRQGLYLQDVVESAKIRAFFGFNLKDGFRYDGSFTFPFYEAETKEFEKKLTQYLKAIKYSGKDDYDFDRKY